MEFIGIFNIDDLIYVFILYLIFILRINRVFDEFCEVFNYYKVCIEGNWLLY